MDHAAEQDASAAGRRARRLVSALRAAAAGTPADLADRLAAAAAAGLGAQGASLCTLLAPGMSVPVGVSDGAAARAERVQFSSGEGPCWEAYRSGGVVVADLTDDAVRRRWPAYVQALQRQTDFCFVVSLPVRLASGPLVALTTYESGPGAADWWTGEPSVVAPALRDLLDGASAPGAPRGAVWLDSSTTLRRSQVWMAEVVLIDLDDVDGAAPRSPAMDHPLALRALRTFSAVEGTTVDETAAALVEGRLTARQVLGRAGS